MKRIMALLLSLVCLATTLSAQEQDTTALSAQDLPTLERTFDTFSPDLQDALGIIMRLLHVLSERSIAYLADY